MKYTYTFVLFSLLAIGTSSAFVASGTSFGNKNRISRSTIASSSAADHLSSGRTFSQTVASSLFMSNTESITNTKYDTVKVDLSDGRDYPIYIGDGFDDVEAGKLLRSHITGKRALLITNDRIEQWYLEKYRNILQNGGEIQIDTLVLPDGEANKNMQVLEMILDKCLTLGLDRKVTLIALGGGVIGDMVGFASAIYQRGVNFIQIPTTVMAMVDSSVGGKTGVNHPLGKNMIGAFHQPQCVFIDTKNLETLPDREMQSGVAEVIKYGLIRDAPFFEWLEENMERIMSRDAAALRYSIKRSCENKAEVVKADELEAGLRATLNLGHTFGHAIENGSGYGSWLHGEAVAIGTCMAATMSHKMGWIDETLVKRIYDILLKAQCPVELPVDSPMNRETFLKAMSVDKKVANGKLRLILLKGELGNCLFTGDFDENAMIETIDEFVAECKGTTTTGTQ
mmetsp:Transcript_12659/g.23727  ORF Transcript_12659/g.23727 Transcript_12659/m.23727 type:complete len:454 (-) Transcript_12659:114-1475(-)